MEIEGGRAVKNADDCEDLVVGSKVLPKAGRGSDDDGLEAQGGGMEITGRWEKGDSKCCG